MNSGKRYRSFPPSSVAAATRSSRCPSLSRSKVVTRIPNLPLLRLRLVRRNWIWPRSLTFESAFDEAGEVVANPPPPKPSSESDRKQLSKGEAALREEAKSQHHPMTHIPKNPFCPTRQKAKMYKPPSYQTNGSRLVQSEKFGDHVTGDRPSCQVRNLKPENDFKRH